MNNAISSFVTLDEVTAFTQISPIWFKKPFNRKEDWNWNGTAIWNDWRTASNDRQKK
jgi:hypothetical protein